jgi:plasmid stabilization system protein ParE
VNVIYRPQFWFDLEGGVTYLAEEASPEIASQWHQEVMATVRRVENQPDLGRLRRDLVPPGIRSLIVRRYPRYLLFPTTDS